MNDQGNLKRRHVKYLVCFLLFLCTTVTYGQDKKIGVAELPQKAKRFLNEYYSRIDVASVSEDVKSWFESNAYRVKLKDGKQIKFDESGDWKEVDGKRTALPLTLVPDKVIAYVKRSFPKTEVVKIQRSAKRYLVAISNGLELEFNEKGKFLKIKQE